VNVIIRLAGATQQLDTSPPDTKKIASNRRKSARIQQPEKLSWFVRTIQWAFHVIWFSFSYCLATIGAIAISIAFFLLFCVIAFLIASSYLWEQPLIKIRHVAYAPLQQTDSAQFMMLQEKSLDLKWPAIKKINIKPLSKSELMAVGRRTNTNPSNEEKIPPGVDQETAAPLLQEITQDDMDSPSVKQSAFGDGVETVPLDSTQTRNKSLF
jgi:hypothetical protein